MVRNISLIVNTVLVCEDVILDNFFSIYSLIKIKESSEYECPGLVNSDNIP